MNSSVINNTMSTALRYELAWNFLFENCSSWKKHQIIEEPQGRYASDLAKEVAKLAESDKDIPITNCNYKVNEPAVSGTK